MSRTIRVTDREYNALCKAVAMFENYAEDDNWDDEELHELENDVVEMERVLEKWRNAVAR